MQNLIDSADIAEALDLGDEDDVSDITATEGPTDAPIEFHVQMNSYTMRDMEAAIVEAAARMVLNRSRYNSESAIEKRIEQAVIEKTSAALNAKLESLTVEIINQPVAAGGKDVMTIGEAIGLFGREYLTVAVNRDGKTKAETGDGWGFNADGRRIDHILRKVIDHKFKSEISSAISGLITEVRQQTQDHAKAFLAEERKRIAAAFAADATKK
jgi:hypothetical protein